MLTSIVVEAIRPFATALIQKNESELLSIDEACDFTGLAKSTIYKLVFDRKIPYQKQRKKLLFSKEQLKVWLDRKEVVS